ncbi:MAG: PIN domain-containing protein [Nitrososphaerota archaeon]|jgi:predicted nucleic acid-binding protein|nr:PIN domain-containing protein [Nitrososphaerota archaeon]
MRKPRIYLDTSLISYLDQQDTPEKMAVTHELWKLLQQGNYEIIISSLTFDELGKAIAKKRTIFAEYLKLINYTYVPITPDQKELTQKYLQHEVLRKKDRDDLIHIACSVSNNCDYIVSWNFNHMVNIKTINKVNSVNLLCGYREVKIVPPQMLL